MTEKDLIAKLTTLKNIKPNQTWVVLTRNNIVAKKAVSVPGNATFASNVLAGFRLAFVQKGMAYSLAAFLLLAFGVYGMFTLNMAPDANNVKNATAALIIQTDLVNNVTAFKEKSQNLSQVSRTNPKDVPVAIQEVKEAAKVLADIIKKEPTLASEIALDVNNSKTYLNVPGSSDLQQTSEDLYKTIDEQMIADLEASTLNADQEKALVAVKELYEKGEYASALENILLINTSK